MPFSEGSLAYTVSWEKKLSIPFLKALLLLLLAGKAYALLLKVSCLFCQLENALFAFPYKPVAYTVWLNKTYVLL